MLFPDNEQGPGVESEALRNRLAGGKSIVVHCSRCGAVLTAHSSVSRGTGPVCNRLGGAA